ncbi:TMPS5 protease, partial [Dicaeum eximium]|nr:TMPS5 protease [Dicaeum eximium]
AAEVSPGCPCTARTLLLLLGVAVLLAGTAAGTWLLVKHTKEPQAEQGDPQEQDLEAMAACDDDGEEEEPVVRAAPSTVSFRINSANSLLEARLAAHPGWLLVCHGLWEPSLGTLLCRQLGFLSVTQQKGVNLSDVRVSAGQQFLQVRARRAGSLQDMWQLRSSCQSGRIVALQCSECGLQAGAVRVVGGTDVSPGRWPWQVSVCQGSRHRCGGSVLAPEWILTAAHCVHRYLGYLSWQVFAGIVTHSSLGPGAGVPVRDIIPHPLYSDSSLDYDIALLRLRVPLNVSGAIRAACLPPSPRDLLQGTQCWVSGWGYTAPGQAQVAGTLKEALVPLIGTRRCNSSCVYKGELTARMLCAGHLRGQVDACQGDSGGPLVCWDGSMWRLVGIVSWGQGCAEPNHPGVYTNVAQLLPWIHQVTQVSPALC